MLLKNTAFNLVGFGAPLVVAIVTIPLLLSGLGDEKFGLLALLWSVVSYASVLDLGLGRAVTLRLAAPGVLIDDLRFADIAGTGLLALSALGIGLAALLAAISRPTVDLVGGADPDEIVAAAYAMAAALPFILAASGLRGILEARHAFATINLIRGPLGVFTFLGPLLVLYAAGPRIDLIAWCLTAGRVAAAIAYAVSALGRRRVLYRFNWPELRALARMGGWLSLANAVGLLMGYADRFVIAGALSVAAVAYYATPQELVTKLWIIPSSLTAVLFPALVANLHQPAEIRRLLLASMKLLSVCLFPICAILAFAAHPILALWINPEFAAKSAGVLSVLSLGVFVNSLAHVPSTFLQAAGRAKLVAIIQLLETPVYLAALWFVTVRFGIIGTALVWLTRMVIDTSIMLACSRMLWRASFDKIETPCQTERFQ